MELEIPKQFENLKHQIQFINISNNEQSLVDWRPVGLFANYDFELKDIRKTEIRNYYFKINKISMNIYYLKKKDFFFSIGVEKALQRQLVEAVLDVVIEKLYDAYDFEVLISYGSIDSTMFKTFKNDIEEILSNFDDLNIVKTIRVPCSVCINIFPIIVKRNLIEKAPHYPVPVVCTHEDHDLLVYIDKEYKVRGMSPITFA